MAHLAHHSSTPYCAVYNGVHWDVLVVVVMWQPACVEKTYQTKSLSPIPPCCASLVLQIVVIVVPP